MLRKVKKKNKKYKKKKSRKKQKQKQKIKMRKDGPKETTTPNTSLSNDSSKISKNSFISTLDKDILQFKKYDVSEKKFI